jgi:hypothetical protein
MAALLRALRVDHAGRIAADSTRLLTLRGRVPILTPARGDQCAVMMLLLCHGWQHRAPGRSCESVAAWCHAWRDEYISEEYGTR